MIDLPPADPGIEINIASRGYSKGLAQTDGIQLLVRPELAIGPIVLGAYAKNVTSSTLDGEAGMSLGLRTDAGGFDLAASATWKHAIEPRRGSDDQSLELSGSVARRFGPLNARMFLTWSPDDLGGTEETLYAETELGFRLGHSTTLGGRIGRRERGGGPDYTAFNIGVTHTVLPGISADLRWYDTSRSRLGDAFEGRLVAALRARF